MTQTMTTYESKQTDTVVRCSLTAAMVLAFSVPGYTADLPASLSGKASDGLVTLATTGNPEPLHTELGGTVISSEELQKKADAGLKLKKGEHLAPKALVAPSGEMYAMVAPTITKDNFIFANGQGTLLRVDVGDSEGHRMPFVIEDIVKDGGTPWYVEFWRWISGQ